MLAISLLG